MLRRHTARRRTLQEQELHNSTTVNTRIHEHEQVACVHPECTNRKPLKERTFEWTHWGHAKRHEQRPEEPRLLDDQHDASYHECLEQLRVLLSDVA